MEYLFSSLCFLKGNFILPSPLVLKVSTREAIKFWNESVIPLHLFCDSTRMVVADGNDIPNFFGWIEYS